MALGPTDTASGLQWGYAASLANGQAEGFRPASFADLSLLLKDGGFYVNESANSGNGSLYLGYQTYKGNPYLPGHLGNSPVLLSEGDSGYVRAGSALGFGLTQGTNAPLVTVSRSGQGHTLGYLNGRTEDLGWLSRRPDSTWYQCYGEGCPGGRAGTVGVVTTLSNDYAARWGESSTLISSLSQVMTQNPDASSSGARVVNSIDPSKIGYFMVKPTGAVPEAASTLTFTMGLGMLVAARRQRLRPSA